MVDAQKNYPFEYNKETILGDSEGEKLTYRRRGIHGRTVQRNNGTITVDNRWIVPHNLYLAAKYNAHINVEVCNQINSIKYVYKGHDRAQANLGNNEQQDEIKNFLDARYVSAAEACWKSLSFPMHKEFPSCQRLDVHLQGDRLVYLDENDHPADVVK